MDPERRRTRFRSFVIGGLLGSVAGVAAAGRVRMRRDAVERQTPVGLSAFEQAPCFLELVESERQPRR